MSKKAKNPFEMGYNPELHTSPKFDPNTASYYLSIIGILRWMIELGRDIKVKVSLLSPHVVMLREGHLEAAVHIMANVGQRYNSRLDSKEVIPLNAPEP